MQTRIRIWSEIGYTPVTRRAGSYCDLLADVTVDCLNPAEAVKEGKAILAKTPFGVSGHFEMPEWPNQNTRSNYFSKR